MALQLTYENEMGVSGNYWKIDSLVLDYAPRSDEDACRLIVNCYKDAAARAADKLALATRQYEWTGEDFVFESDDLDPLNMNPQKQAYTKLKTLPEFSGASDV